MSFAILNRLTAIVFELAARFDHRRLSRPAPRNDLRASRKAIPVRCSGGASLCREIADADLSPVPTAVPPSASSCRASIACSARRLPEANLLRVTAKFLAEADWRGVHQMGAPDLDYVVEFVRLRGERGVAIFQVPE